MSNITTMPLKSNAASMLLKQWLFILEVVAVPEVPELELEYQTEATCSISFSNPNHHSEHNPKGYPQPKF